MNKQTRGMETYIEGILNSPHSFLLRSLENNINGRYKIDRVMLLETYNDLSSLAKEHNVCCTKINNKLRRLEDVLTILNENVDMHELVLYWLKYIKGSEHVVETTIKRDVYLKLQDIIENHVRGYVTYNNRYNDILELLDEIALESELYLPETAEGFNKLLDKMESGRLTIPLGENLTDILTSNIERYKKHYNHILYVLYTVPQDQQQLIKYQKEIVGEVIKRAEDFFAKLKKDTVILVGNEINMTKILIQNTVTILYNLEDNLAERSGRSLTDLQYVYDNMCGLVDGDTVVTVTHRLAVLRDILDNQGDILKLYPLLLEYIVGHPLAEVIQVPSTFIERLKPIRSWYGSRVNSMKSAQMRTLYAEIVENSYRD